MIKQPLWLPNGSVRALLATVLVGTTAYLFATAQVVPTELQVLTGIVMTFYFLSRDGTTPEPEVEIFEPYVGDPS